MSRLWSLCVFSMLSFKALATPSIDVITVEYPPFASRFMQNEGLVFELLRDHYPLPPVWSYSSYFVPPARAQHMVENESWCISLYPPRKPSDHVKFIALGGEEVKLGFAVHINSVLNKWQSAQSLEGKVVALLRSKTPSEAQLLFEEKKADILYVEQVEQGVEMLYRHRVDMAFVDHITFKQMRKEHEDWHDIEFSDDILRSVPVGVFYNSQCPHRVMLNKVFKLAPI
jgi:polar amino acid transport system substrate-binding protein